MQFPLQIFGVETPDKGFPVKASKLDADDEGGQGLPVFSIDLAEAWPGKTKTGLSLAPFLPISGLGSSALQEPLLVGNEGAQTSSAQTSESVDLANVEEEHLGKPLNSTGSQHTIQSEGPPVDRSVSETTLPVAPIKVTPVDVSAQTSDLEVQPNSRSEQTSIPKDTFGLKADASTLKEDKLPKKSPSHSLDAPETEARKAEARDRPVADPYGQLRSGKVGPIVSQPSAGNDDVQTGKIVGHAEPEAAHGGNVKARIDLDDAILRQSQAPAGPPERVLPTILRRSGQFPDAEQTPTPKQTPETPKPEARAASSRPEFPLIKPMPRNTFFPVEVTFRPASPSAPRPEIPSAPLSTMMTTDGRLEPGAALQTMPVSAQGLRTKAMYRTNEEIWRPGTETKVRTDTASLPNTNSGQSVPATMLPVQSAPVPPAVGLSKLEKTSLVDDLHPRDSGVSTPRSEITETRRESAISPKFEPVARPVIQQLVSATKSLQDGSVEIRLSPEELGRVRLSLSPGEATMSVQISVERPETLDLIRRNIDLFSQSLKQEGFLNLSFSFSGSNTGEPGDQGDEATPLHSGETDTNEDLPLPHPNRRTLSIGQLDIRI